MQPNIKYFEPITGTRNDSQRQLNGSLLRLTPAAESQRRQFLKPAYPQRRLNDFNLEPTSRSVVSTQGEIHLRLPSVASTQKQHEPHLRLPPIAPIQRQHEQHRVLSSVATTLK